MVRIPLKAPLRPRHLVQEVSTCIWANKVFRNDYLLDLIAGFGCDRASLLSLMQVTMSCFLVVRKYIWETIPTAYNILRLLPFFTYEDDMWVIPKNTEPSAWEWQRFDLYAPCVCRIVSLSSSTVVGEYDINPLTYLYLASARGSKSNDSPIFPRLQMFSFHGTGMFYDVGPSRIDYLCTPILEDVEIRANSTHLQTYLCNLAVSADTLTSLAIIGRFTSHCFTTLMRFQNLKKLLLQPTYSNQTDKHLLSPQVTQFLGVVCKHIPLTKVILRTYISFPLPSGCFNSVEHLEIQEASSTMINILGSGSFRTVILQFTRFELISTYQDCFSALVRSSLETLESLTVHSHAEIKHDFPIMHCIEPILSVPNLRELCIHHGNILSMALSDRDISRMAHAWPDLRQLILLSSTATAAGRIRSQQPTFGSVRVLLRMRCLQDFSIRAEDLPIEIQLPLQDHSMTTLLNYPSPLKQYLLWSLRK